MPISFEPKEKVFHLHNDRISYYFFINGEGYLQHLYFGPRLDEVSIEGICSRGDWSWQYYDDEEDKETMSPGKYYPEFSSMETTLNGGFDKRTTDIVLEQSNGSFYTAFHYVAHRVYPGKDKLNGLPSAKAKDNEAMSLEIELQDQLSGLTLYLTYCIYEHSDVLTRSIRLVNKTGDPVKVRRAKSLLLDLPSSSYDLIHFHGEWSKEQILTRQCLKDGKVEIASSRGFSGHQETPFLVLCGNKTNEDHGEAIGFHLVYSGSFSFTAEVTNFKTTRVVYGLNDEDFLYSLNPGDSLDCPEVILSYSHSGLTGLSLTIHDFIRAHLMDNPFVYSRRPIVLNSWDGIGIKFNTKQILEAIKRAKDIESELFVLDDGWFGARDDDTTSLGDWTVYEEKVDLQQVIDYCHSQGMKFGIWVEPEMISPHSKLYKEHPEYALRLKGAKCALGRHQLVIDMANPKVVDNLFDQIASLLKSYPIDYVKWDFNRYLSEAYSEYLGTDHQGEVYPRFMLGTYSLLTRLTQAFPSIMWETCASGGGRLDAGMIPYSMQIQASDTDDAIERAYMLYGYSFGYPLSCFSTHVFSWNKLDYYSKAAIALFSAYGFEIDPGKLNEKEKEEIRRVNRLYETYHLDCIQNGDLYRLKSPYEDNAVALIAVSKAKDKAIALYVNILREIHYSRFLKIKGLDPKRRYRNSLDQTSHTGAYYAQVGLNLIRYFNEFDTLLITFDSED